MNVQSRRNRQSGGVSLEHHLETQINLQFAAMNRAVDTAKDSMEKRLDGMNEFRESLKDQAAKFITRTELLAAVIGLSTIISIVVSILMRLKG